MAIDRTMEDWFLRGGEKPQYNGMQTVAVAVCQNCGHENPADAERCKHCFAPLVGGPSTAEICGDDEDDLADDEDESDEREFEVTLERKRIIWQRATVRVTADCKETAMSTADELAEDGQVDGWNDVGSEDYEGIEATDVEEL